MSIKPGTLIATVAALTALAVVVLGGPLPVAVIVALAGAAAGAAAGKFTQRDRDGRGIR